MNAKRAKELRREAKKLAEGHPKTEKRVYRRAKEIYLKERAR